MNYHNIRNIFGGSILVIFLVILFGIIGFLVAGISFLVAGIISLMIFVLIYQFWALPIRTTDPSGKEVKSYYDKEKDCFKIRSGEAPYSFVDEEFVDMLKNRNKETQIIVEDMICIGKREKGVFTPSPLLLFYFSQEKEKRKIEIKMIKNGAYLKGNITYHPEHFHYRIYDNAIFFHGEDNVTYYLRGSWYMKKKFKKKFDKEWEKGEPLDKAFSEMEEKEKLLVEIIDGDKRLHGKEYEKAKYEKATKEEIEKFKEVAKIKEKKEKQNN